MGVLALTSAKGAPGVSTAALAMTLLWPRAALLAECDPAGGSSVLAGYLRGTVEHSRGLLSLALALPALFLTGGPIASVIALYTVASAA